MWHPSARRHLQLHFLRNSGDNFTFLRVAETGTAPRSAPPRPYITLLRPNGGDSWMIGQYQNIHWSRQNPSGNTVDIDYSTDNGTTWIRIATQANGHRMVFLDRARPCHDDGEGANTRP